LQLLGLEEHAYAGVVNQHRIGPLRDSALSL
jgi:hypothetical protein